jgi:hypothetical protein
VKRRYKAGDWFVAPLPSGRAVTGIIARSAASRLFGYLFRGIVPRDELAGLRPGDALWSGLFNARAIEDHRWRVVATSLRFERERWPMPAFGVREPFGRSWSVRTMDDETLTTRSTHHADEHTASALPDARIYEPEHLEALLDNALDSNAQPAPLVVIDVHAPLDAVRLRLTPAHARIQIGEPLGTKDTAILAAFLNAREDVSLRLYGNADRASLLELVWLVPSLRRLELDVEVDTLALFYPLEALEELAVRRARDAEMPLPQRFRSLRALELRGTLEHRRQIAHLPALRRLTLQAAGWDSTAPLEGADHLHRVDFSDMPLRDIGMVRLLPSLRAIALRRCAVDSLEPLRGSRVEALTIDGERRLTDLTPLRDLPNLRTLTVRAMPHLNVHDLRVVAEIPSLQNLRVDLGSRSKNREVYRLAHASHLREVGL